MGAIIAPVLNPIDLTTVPGYRPSTALARFVRTRDLTCCFPGCDRPAVYCDVDHTIPYTAGGLTHPGNLKCLCRKHHLLKTFWVGRGGWSDEQLPDGTVVWTTPAGRENTFRPAVGCCSPTGTPRPPHPPPRYKQAHPPPAANSPCRYASAPAPNNTATTSQPNAHATTNTTSTTHHPSDSEGWFVSGRVRRTHQTPTSQRKLRRTISYCLSSISAKTAGALAMTLCAVPALPR